MAPLAAVPLTASLSTPHTRRTAHDRRVRVRYPSHRFLCILAGKPLPAHAPHTHTHTRHPTPLFRVCLSTCTHASTSSHAPHAPQHPPVRCCLPALARFRAFLRCTRLRTFQTTASGTLLCRHVSCISHNTSRAYNHETCHTSGIARPSRCSCSVRACACMPPLLRAYVFSFRSPTGPDWPLSHSLLSRDAPPPRRPAARPPASTQRRHHRDSGQPGGYVSHAAYRQWVSRWLLRSRRRRRPCWWLARARSISSSVSRFASRWPLRRRPGSCRRRPSRRHRPYRLHRRTPPRSRLSTRRWCRTVSPPAACLPMPPSLRPRARRRRQHRSSADTRRPFRPPSHTRHRRYSPDMRLAPARTPAVSVRRAALREWDDRPPRHRHRRSAHSHHPRDQR